MGDLGQFEMRLGVWENKKVAMNQAFQEELEDRDIILKTQEEK